MELKDAIALYAAIVSTFAVTVSLGTLLWQIISWRLSGHRIQVDAFISAPRIGWGADERLNWYRDGEPYIEIEVYNTGRGPVAITGVGLTWWRQDFLRWRNKTGWYIPIEQFKESKRVEPGRDGFVHKFVFETPEEYRAIVNRPFVRPYAEARGRRIYKGKRLEPLSTNLFGPFFTERTIRRGRAKREVDERQEAS